MNLYLFTVIIIFVIVIIKLKTKNKIISNFNIIFSITLQNLLLHSLSNQINVTSSNFYHNANKHSQNIKVKLLNII